MNEGQGRGANLKILILWLYCYLSHERVFVDLKVIASKSSVLVIPLVQSEFGIDSDNMFFNIRPGG